MLVVVNLALLMAVAAPAVFTQPAVAHLVWPHIAVFTLIFAVFVNAYLIWKFRRDGKRRGPNCPVCGSSDVSFGGEIADNLPGNAWLAALLVLLSGVGVLIQSPWGQQLLATSFFERYAFTVPIFLLAVQLLSSGLTSAWRWLFVNPADVDVRWVCETCRNVWHVDKLAEGENVKARAPLIQ